MEQMTKENWDEMVKKFTIIYPKENTQAAAKEMCDRIDLAAGFGVVYDEETDKSRYCVLIDNKKLFGTNEKEEEADDGIL